MESPINRRQILKNSILGGVAGLAGVAGMAQAQAICKNGMLTPAQTEGPFYPVKLQADLDADLTLLKGQTERARGEIVDLWVLVQNEECQAIPDALVDLWQACATGKYDNPKDPNPAEVDPFFQYWAKVRTDSAGIAKIRTIKPGAYPAGEDWIRPPHIHFKISAEGYAELTTQMYFSGEALNRKDSILNELKPADREKLIVKFTRDPQSTIPKGVFTTTLKTS